MNLSRTTRQSGSALVYTLLTLTVLSIFLSIIYERVIGLMRSSREWLWTEKALVASESGLALAESHLLQNPGWSAGENSTPEVRLALDESDITIRTDRFRPPDIIWLFSTGSYRNKRKDTVRPVMVHDPTIFSMMARRKVRLGSGTIVTGSIFGADVRLEEGTEVVGSIISSGTLLTAREQTSAMVFDSVAAVPEVPDLNLKSLAAAWSQTIPGTTIESTLTPGAYRSVGDVTIRNATETAVLLLVQGSLALEGRVILRASPSADTPVLIVEKNIIGTLSGARIWGTIYAGGKVSLKGEGLIVGTIIADEIEISDGVVVQSFESMQAASRAAPAFWKRKILRIRN